MKSLHFPDLVLIILTKSSFRINRFFQQKCGPLISAPGCSLSAGRAVSLLDAARLRGLTCPATPAGVSHLPLQSTQQIIYINQATNCENSLTKRKEIKYNH
ncbi:hypothetical protein ABE66_20400 [Cytobacillus firmus]|nr:hypothetical protein [Cytobacillus firmus]